MLWQFVSREMVQHTLWKGGYHAIQGRTVATAMSPTPITILPTHTRSRRADFWDMSVLEELLGFLSAPKMILLEQHALYHPSSKISLSERFGLLGHHIRTTHREDRSLVPVSPLARGS
jgi:hypothetical protein